MPYVRIRGSQLVLVHGARHPETKQVEQQILHTWYSRTEAEAAVAAAGRRATVEPILRAELELDHPGIRFDWAKIAETIHQHMHILPDDHGAREARYKDRLRGALVGCVREVAGSSPQAFRVAREALAENRVGLEFLAELVTTQLKLLDRTEHSVRPPSWDRVPREDGQPTGDLEEIIAGQYESGEHERLAGILALLVEAYPRYADGHNYLGLIAFDRRDWATAAGHFERAAEIGRTLFGKRLAKQHYWLELSTRPWIRARHNLGLALAEAGDARRALALADKIEREVGEPGGADEIRNRVAEVVDARSHRRAAKARGHHAGPRA